MSELHNILTTLKDYHWINLTHEITEDMAIYQAFNPLKEKY